MLFKETPVFTRLIAELMTDDEYCDLQKHLIKHPDSGVLIPGGGGVRKIRWSGSGRGKRGGTRVIYYWAVPDWMYMLLAFKKNETENLPAHQLKHVRRIAEEWHNEQEKL